MTHREEAERILASRRHAHGDTAAVGILHAVLALGEKPVTQEDMANMEARWDAEEMEQEEAAAQAHMGAKHVAAHSLAELLREQKRSLFDNQAAKAELYETVVKWLRRYGEEV